MSIDRKLFCFGLLLVIFSSIGFAAELPKGVIKKSGELAPTLKLKTIDGELFDLQSVKGHWAFVHFWASWCGPCRREMPTIQFIKEKLNPQQWTFVVVNTAEDEDTIFNFIGAVAPDLVPLMDSDGQVTEAWQSRGLPSTFLVDPEGRIQYLVLGGRPWDKDGYLAFLNSLPGKK